MARKRGSRPSKLGDQVRRLRDDGLSIRDIQAELEISRSTIYRLLRSSTIKPVVVEEEEEATKQRQTVALVTPDGFRFEGLDTETAADLWRTLR